MKTKLLLMALLMALCAESFAQDVIQTLDSRRIEAKVLEITDDYIRYKTFDNLEGPDYRMSVDRVVRIVFENGTEKAFAPARLFDPYEGIGPYGLYGPNGSYGPCGPLSYRWGHYYDRERRLYSEELRDRLGVALYGSEYLQAQRQFQWGQWLTLGGGALLTFALASGAMVADFNRSTAAMGMRHSAADHMETAFLVASGLAGAAGLGFGIPLWVKGNRKLNALADDYNRRFGQSPSLEMGPTATGLGLTLRF
jgi:hypothetical protein